MKRASEIRADEELGAAQLVSAPEAAIVTFRTVYRSVRSTDPNRAAAAIVCMAIAHTRLGNTKRSKRILGLANRLAPAWPIPIIELAMHDEADADRALGVGQIKRAAMLYARAAKQHEQARIMLQNLGESEAAVRELDREQWCLRELEHLG